MYRHLFLPAVFGALLSPAGAEGSCLRLDDIHTWTVPDDHTVIVRDYENNGFQVKLKSACTGLGSDGTLSFKSAGDTELGCVSGSDYLQRRRQPSRCTVLDVEPLATKGNKEANMNVR